MATIRENARFGAALSVLLASGCLSQDESLFRGVAAPEEGAEAGEAALDAQPGTTPAVVTAPVLSTPEQPFASDVPLASGAGAGDSASASDTEEPAAPEPAEPAEAVTPADPCALPSALACDSFEADTDGAFPAGPGWLPELPGCGSHVVDGAGPAFSGVRALRASDGAYPECMLHADLSGEDDVYVRTRVLLGPGAGLLTQYSTLLEFGARAEQDDPELRVGVRPATDSLCTGVPGLDVTGSGLRDGPETECTGVALEQERWYCLEAHLTREGVGLNVDVSLDGMPVVERSFTGGPAWAGRGLFVKLGRAAYGAASRGSFWHDDIAVSREPIPCDP